MHTNGLIIISILLLSIYSCSDTDDTVISACGVDKPLLELGWLKAEIGRRAENPSDEMKYCYIVQGSLAGNDVFIYQDCNPFINKAIFVLDCQGNALQPQGEINLNSIEDTIVIWKGTNFACNLN